MSGTLDIGRLRAAAPPEQAVLLRNAVSAPGADVVSLTDELLGLIRAGSIAPPIAQVWLGVTRHPDVAVACLRQAQSAIARRKAMLYIRRHLRSQATFAHTWHALGGAEGIANLMAKLSVNHVQDLCATLGAIATAGSDDPADRGGVRSERQRNMTDLFLLLNDTSRNLDTRPLKLIYTRLLPACLSDIALNWAEETNLVNRRLWRWIRKAHPVASEQRVLNDTFNETKDHICLDILLLFVADDLDFGIRVLNRLAECDTLRVFTPTTFLAHLAVPLMRRCGKSRSSEEKCGRLVDAINICLSKHASLRAELNRSRSNGTKLFACAITAWDAFNARPKFEQALATLICLVPKESASLERLDTLIQLVRPSLRYQLARLLYHKSPAYGFDIGPASSTDSKMLADFKIGRNVFTKLPSIEAVSLFERALEANPDFGFLLQPCGYLRRTSILSERADFGGSSDMPDGHLVRALLIQRAKSEYHPLPKNSIGVLDSLRTTELAQRKKRAEKGREPAERAFWSIQALLLCVGLGDYELFASTLKWAWRFNSDSRTVQNLYTSTVVLADEVMDMLCVLPAKAAFVENVGEKILQANAVLEKFLKTATMALRQPTFQARDWDLILSNLIPEVVARRLERVGAFQKLTGMRDETVFDSVLQPSLDVLVKTEATLLKPEHERLGMQTPSGLLKSSSYSSDVKIEGTLVSFFDSLARARDSLWGMHRAQLNPDVITLQVPWPRGLPIQCLLSGEAQRYSDIPYMQQRAEAIVFCDVSIALCTAPEDMETQAAVGPFIDSWSHALKLYVAGASCDQTREQRIARAWAYATHDLRGDRMSPSEARRLWLPVFARAEVKPYNEDEAPETSRLPANLPSGGYPQHLMEWDPDPLLHRFEAPSKSRRLHEVACIDCMLTPSYPQSENWKSKMPLATVIDTTVPGNPQAPSFWNHATNRRKLEDSTIDAYIAASVLVLNSKYGSSTSIFRQPLSLTAGERFPTVYLDEDFLERNKADDPRVNRTLEHFGPHIPHLILANLAGSMLQRLQDEENETRRDYQQLVNVVHLLLKGDCPSAAGPIICQFITDSPEASSWHRKLLNSGTLCALEPNVVKRFFISLSKAVMEKLKTQREQSSAALEVEDSALRSIRPLIKVTTVKMVAQLLDDTRFVGPPLAFDILSRLLHGATHLDIRVAAVDGLINLIDHVNLKPRIIDLLRSRAVPVAASLNESQPVKEPEWEAAVKKGSPPDIRLEASVHPVLEKLLQCNEKEKNSELTVLAYEALRLSSEKHSQWMTLFFQQHGFALADGILPPIPVYPLVEAFRETNLSQIPVAEFETMRNHVRILLNPPSDVAEITKRVKADKALAHSEPGKHWLVQWERKDSRCLEVGGSWFATHLGDFLKIQSEGKSGPVTGDMVEAFVLEMAEALLLQGHVDTFGRLIQSLRPEFDALREVRVGPRHVLEYLIQRIDSLRSPEWQANRQRQPASLPGTFPLQLKLIVGPNSDAPAEHISVFAGRAISLLEQLVGSGLPFHDQYLHLQGAVVTGVTQKQQLAVLFGSPSHFRDPEHPSLADYLRAKMASALIGRVQSIEGDESHFAEEVKVMMQEWEESPAEELRNEAAKLRKRFRAHSGRSNFDSADWLYEDLSEID